MSLSIYDCEMSEIIYRKSKSVKYDAGWLGQRVKSSSGTIVGRSTLSKAIM